MANETVRPSADQAAGDWTTDAGAATNLYQAVDEETASDTDYIRSTIRPANSRVKLALGSPVDTPDGSGTHTLRYRYGLDDGSESVEMRFRLLEGTTEIASWMHVVSTGYQTAEKTLTSGEVSAITDYTNLFLEVTASVAGPKFFVTVDEQTFITSNGANFVVAADNTFVTSDPAVFVTADGDVFVVGEGSDIVMSGDAGDDAFVAASGDEQTGGTYLKASEA